MTIKLKQLTMGTGLNIFNGQTDNDCQEPLTKVFAIAGLDGRTISSKSLINFSPGIMLIISNKMYLKQ